MAEENNFVSFICVSCKQEIEAAKEMVGQTVECPACGRTIRIELSDL